MELVCDFCGKGSATVYCRADSARLCLPCDYQVHSANALSRRHHRTLLCDGCSQQSAIVNCPVDNLSLCQFCDWNTHSSSIDSQHQCRKIASFMGCPSATELARIWGFELDSSEQNASWEANQSTAETGRSTPVPSELQPSEAGWWRATSKENASANPAVTDQRSSPIILSDVRSISSLSRFTSTNRVSDSVGRILSYSSASDLERRSTQSKAPEREQKNGQQQKAVLQQLAQMQKRQLEILSNVLQQQQTFLPNVLLQENLQSETGLSRSSSDSEEAVQRKQPSRKLEHKKHQIMAPYLMNKCHSQDQLQWLQASPPECNILPNMSPTPSESFADCLTAIDALRRYGIEKPVSEQPWDPQLQDLGIREADYAPFVSEVEPSQKGSTKSGGATEASYGTKVNSTISFGSSSKPSQTEVSRPPILVSRTLKTSLVREGFPSSSDVIAIETPECPGSMDAGILEEPRDNAMLHYREKKKARK